MLATPAPSPGVLPTGADWSFEVKWDGVRAIADTTSGVPRLWSRNEREITAAYPELTGLASLPGVVLDGEIVQMSDGRPSFAALAERMHVRDARRAQALAERSPVTYLVFDVLRAADDDLARHSYDERRAVLETLDLPEHVELSPAYDDGAGLWQITAEHGLEGVVAKRRSSTYRAGRRSPDWVKAAHHGTRAALVGGWRGESTGTGRLGALLLGAPDEHGALRYLGRAGSGLTGTLATTLTTLLAHAGQADSPFADEVPPEDARGAHWCTPVLVVDTRYLTRTPTGRLRQPVVRGLRTDTEPDPWERA
ncbi:ATP-dependent DNA ligase [Cellulomonas rhizosphaerae]|uniref:DNA ligase (ATP) n=1 Tax=Cellulomonas rhizosphaerae TaxID=2293719 RepID=A0A413RNJ2_9CELL|nr:DNA ligase [Cellulomonas rhizosphaerae]RHA43503.1 DNA ligase [Cellulomonas rhizosphaerae]